MAILEFCPSQTKTPLFFGVQKLLSRKVSMACTCMMYEDTMHEKWEPWIQRIFFPISWQEIGHLPLYMGIWLLWESISILSNYRNNPCQNRSINFLKWLPVKMESLALEIRDLNCVDLELLYPKQEGNIQQSIFFNTVKDQSRRILLFGLVCLETLPSPAQLACGSVCTKIITCANSFVLFFY